MYVYVPILAVHAERLGASMGLVGTIVGAYGFAQLLLRIPVGVWSDRIGVRKPFIAAGLASTCIGALGLGLSSDPHWLVLWRGMSGAGAAAWVAFTVLFSSYFAPNRIASAMAQISFVSGVAQVICTYLGGAVAQLWGWHAPFFAGVVLALLGMAAAAMLDEKPLPVRERLTLHEFLRIGSVPLLLAVSIVTMLSTWAIWVTVQGFTLVYAARLGAGPADLGTLTMVGYVASTAAYLLSAHLPDRIGVRATVIAAIVTQAVGAFMVPFVQSMPLVALSQILGGGGRALSYPILMSLSIRAVAPSERATAMGVFQAVYALGMFAGPATAGLLGDLIGLNSVFLVAGLVPLLGIVIVLKAVPSR